jgi:DNA-binding response OmpR family regulator
MKALRILIVEDDALIGTLLAELLARMGHDVCGIEANEADAVAAAVRHRPHLMIVDARLGEESGISAVDEILGGGPVPHIFITGDTAMLETLRPGAVVIQKPFRETELARAMQRALGATAASQRPTLVARNE